MLIKVCWSGSFNPACLESTGIEKESMNSKDEKERYLEGLEERKELRHIVIIL